MVGSLSSSSMRWRSVALRQPVSQQMWKLSRASTSMTLHCSPSSDVSVGMSGLSRHSLSTRKRMWCLPYCTATRLPRIVPPVLRGCGATLTPASMGRN